MLAPNAGMHDTAGFMFLDPSKLRLDTLAVELSDIGPRIFDLQTGLMAFAGGRDTAVDSRPPVCLHGGTVGRASTRE